jgi:ABC-2 type transport system ATP-binding protein
MPPAVEIHSLSHRYGEHLALDNFNLSINPGENFGLLGPNGSGKSTLFRVLSTLIPPQQGRINFFGAELNEKNLLSIRRQIGVVFQSPALDKMLTGEENLRHQGHLYGLRGTTLRQRINDNLAAVGMLEQARRRCNQLSGGQRRRIELAKAMLHQPQLLILDEPSTGLDPAARIDFSNAIDSLRQRGATILLTTHLMDEADRCTRLAILDKGKCVAVDTPDALRQSVGGQVITLATTDPPSLAAELRSRLSIDVTVIENELRIESTDATALLPQLVALCGSKLLRVSMSQPTLQDVFLQRTGRQFD